MNLFGIGANTSYFFDLDERKQGQPELEDSQRDVVVGLFFFVSGAFWNKKDETESDIDGRTGKELEKNRLKVRELCEEMVRKGHAPHLQLDSITSAQLAMETLLSLTSKKAGEWFKEELRVLGGLDHIIQTVTQCTDQLSGDASTGLEVLGQWSWDKHRVDALKKVDRCLRVLENVIQRLSTHSRPPNSKTRCHPDQPPSGGRI